MVQFPGNTMGRLKLCYPTFWLEVLVLQALPEKPGLTLNKVPKNRVNGTLGSWSPEQSSWHLGPSEKSTLIVLV
jgi:hypothetical protein